MYLKEASRAGETEQARWLCDNAQMLLQSINNGIRSLKKNKSKAADKVFAELSDCLNGTENGNAQALFEKAVKKLNIPLELCEETASLTFAAAALRAARLYEKSPNVFPSAVKVLFELRDIDFEELFPYICRAEYYLTLDPDGDYPKCDPQTKAQYRKAVCLGSAERKMSAEDYLRDILSKAEKSVGEKKHIGFYLPIKKDNTVKARLFTVWEFIASAFLSAAAAVLFTKNTDGFFSSAGGRILLSVLIFTPLFGAFRPISDRIRAHLFPPAFLASFDTELSDDIPPTAIAVSSVLPSADRIKEVKEHLRETKLSDASYGTTLVYLCDPKNASLPSVPSDSADIRAAEKMIEELNDELDGGFVLALRDRVFAPSENSYGGYERKRGALCTLVRLITDGKNGFSVLSGDIKSLMNAKYILALDSDTVLPFENLKRLVSIASHPLNRPVYDPEKRRITDGYGIIAPRVETSASSAEKTFFSSFMTLGGISAYSTPVSERYMDMFSSSLFTGKGLIDIAAFSKTCLDAFPDGIILSHDIPEGALMNTAFAGSVCLSDSFPSKPSSYRLRQHRWIRGDMQNLRLLHGTTNGLAFSAKLSPLAKYQLFDNFRRAVTPVLSFLCLIVSVFLPSGASSLLLSAALLSVITEPVVSFLSEAVRIGPKVLTSIYLTASAGVGVKSLVRALYMISSLPEDCAVSFSAIAKGLYRGFVSRRKTLEWTTAAQGEQGRIRSVRQCVFSALSAAALLFGSPFHRLWAVLILINIPFSVSNGIINTKTAEKLSDSDRETLKSYAAAEWRYFEQYVTSSDNYLPPDNVQLTPVKKTAHRTSPTDIGMYMMSCLTAADLSLIGEAELAKRLTDTVKTLQKLRRCSGLLYNWYDTRTLEVLPPYFVSTVDCGNYLCCLLTLGEGLKKMSSDISLFSPVIRFIDSEISSSDLGVLFSEKRGLFSIGLNAANKTLTPSYYDTYMSEMRLTSFFATAMREVPVSHNERLSRMPVSLGLYSSAASWTGTAFEYLMPTLFLPAFDNTFAGEALHNCVREQKRFSHGTPMPWGVSESGFYAFDRELNYKYKAHGIRRLAVKTDADCEKVFSPYSSFLSLSVSPNGAMKNLARFVSLGAFGGCGFYEALDFTEERVKPENYMTVRSFMAHHKGMSLIACGNALFDNINVRRFTGNAKMKAAESLLTEKLPPEVPFSFRPKRQKEAPDNRKRERSVRPESEYFPSCAFFTDGDGSLICSDDGKNIFLFSSLSVFGKRRSVTGIYTAVHTANGTFPLSQNGKGQIRKTCFYNKVVEGDGIFEYSLCMSRASTGIFAPVKITNNSDKARYYELLFYVEPELNPINAHGIHKSYSDMFIKTEYNSVLRCVTFERYENGSVTGALCVGFYSSEPFVFTCRREKVLPIRGNAPFENSLPEFDLDTSGAAPCFASSVGIRLNGGEKRECVLTAAAGEDKTAAINRLSSLRAEKAPKTSLALSYTAFSSNGVQKTAENFLLSEFFFRTDDRKILIARNENSLTLDSLWKHGISGDLGIIRVESDNAPPSLFADFLTLHSVLAKSGCPFDLVFTFRSPDDYTSSVSAKLRSVVKKKGLDGFLGEKGGIHIINLTEGSAEDRLLTAVSDAVFPSDEAKAENKEQTKITSFCAGAVCGTSGFLPNGYFINEPSPFPMSHTLSNGVIGTLLTDTSLGFSWYANARLCPLSPGPYDISEPLTGEMLTLENGSTVTDCIKGSSVFFSDDKAVYRSVIGKIKCDTTVFIAEKGAVKTAEVSLSEISSPCTLSFTFTPVLCERRDFSKMCKTECTENGVYVTNPFNTDYKGFLFVGTEKCAPTVTNDGKIILRVGFDGTEKSSCVTFKIVFSADKKGILPLLALPKKAFKEKRVRFSSGSDDFDRFANALLYHQTADARLRSRTGFYQCSGAYGFRDQLQDAVNIVNYDPKTTRRIILLCAAAQFSEGDVLHWFHLIPSVGKKGVRTRCSDDMLWLPFAAAAYADATGDVSIFEKRIPYLDGEPLSHGEKQRYGLFLRSKKTGTLYEHCMKSIFISCEFGVHGLPLIKDGDWNDSFGEIGIGGMGESVWLAMFLRLVCDKTAKYSVMFGKSEHTELLKKISDRMNERILASSYNGSFFARAFFDDGTPLGNGTGDACKIDLLPQSFAVFANIGTHEIRKKALLCAFNELVDSENKLVKLFSPPFNHKTRRAGYVNDYPEGVRENGGQYTHAAVWFALALLRENLVREAAEVTGYLLPSIKDKRYGREPYAVCGDVYSAKGMEGQGGWSLYTGAAGWMLTLAGEWQKRNTEKDIGTVLPL